MNELAQEIHRSHDEIGPIQVMDDGHKRYLTFGTEDEQSCQLVNQPHLLQHEYTRAALLSLLMVEPKHITVIGIGGGCLLTALNYLLPHCRLQGVELRREVVRLAHKYFQLPKHTGIKLHIGDGIEYIKTSQLKSDIIIADMYLAEGINPEQLSQEFIANSHQRLQQGGWLVLNYWLEHRMEEDLTQVLHKYFDQIYMCSTGGGNWLIFAGKADINSPLIDESKIHGLSQSAGFSLNNYLKRLICLT